MPAVPATPKGVRTRALILKAARRVFARDGYVAARMTDIADEAALSLGAVYRYFENKENVFSDLVLDIHEELFEASRSRAHSLKTDPYGALYESNLGYLVHYFENRDVMRTLVEAATVDERFRDQWWLMRNRHVRRFISVARASFDTDAWSGVDLELTTEAMACMVEQAAYVWFAHEVVAQRAVSPEEAAAVLTQAWLRTLFGESAVAKAGSPRRAVGARADGRAAR